LLEILSQSERVVTIEEYVIDGGIGGAITELCSDNDLNCAILRLGLPCKFIEPGSNEELERAYGLDSAGILNSIRNRWPVL